MTLREHHGALHPSSEFATAGGPLHTLADEFIDITSRFRDLKRDPEHARLDRDERTRRDQVLLMANPHWRRMRELMDAIEAMGLELRDERGRVRRLKRILLFRIPVQPDATIVEAGLALGIEPSDLILQAEVKPRNG